MLLHSWEQPPPIKHFSASSPQPTAQSQPLSASAASSYDMLYVIWISLLIALPNELSATVNAQSTDALLLLPTQPQSLVASPRCPAADPNLNFRPVIGILSHPGDGASGRLSNATNASYIAASYVKFVESAGARVIPLIFNEPLEVLYEVSTTFFFSVKNSLFGGFRYYILDVIGLLLAQIMSVIEISSLIAVVLSIWLY